MKEAKTFFPFTKIPRDMGRVRFAALGLATICFQIALADKAFSQTGYQASSVQDSCVSSNVCKFVFPAPAGNLTILHVSCSIVTTVNSSFVGGINYFKLFSSSTTSQQDFLPSALLTYGSGNTNYVNQLGETTLYFVPAGSSPQINAHTMTTIAAPTSMDEPTCFISGTIN